MARKKPSNDKASEKAGEKTGTKTGESAEERTAVVDQAEECSPETGVETSWWTPGKKALASAAIVFHVFAIFAAPCASPPPSSDTWQRIAGRFDDKDGVLSPYLRAGYLNHGYRFFAPNPGPSHLVRFEIDLASGGKVEGRFPNTEDQFPRLLYHRMFMLSETAFNLASPVLEIPPGSLTEPEQLEFNRQRAAADALAESIARKLLTEHSGKRVRLYLQTHELPYPKDVADGQKLDDPDLYQEQFWCEISAKAVAQNSQTETLSTASRSGSSRESVQ